MATITFPFDGQVFWVPEDDPWLTITVTAESESMYTFIAGEGGELFTHNYSITLDDTTVQDHVGMVAEPGFWTFWLTIGPEALSITDIVGLGLHNVLVEHSVVMSNSQIITIDTDWHSFYVYSYPVPEPSAALLYGLGIITVGWRLRRRRELA